MGILAIRDSTAASSGTSSNDVGKNVGIVLGCLAVLIIMLPIISKSCNCFGRSRDQEETPAVATPATSRRRHLNPAEIMRLCALRDSTRPPPGKPAKKSLLNASEVDLAAPKVSWARIVAREECQSTVTVPSKALVRDQAIRLSADAASTSECAEKDGVSTSASMPEQDDQGPVCSICLEGYEDGDVVRETVCHHVFHSCCLEQWLMKRRSHCPLCQGDLKLKREEC